MVPMIDVGHYLVIILHRDGRRWGVQRINHIMINGQMDLVRAEVNRLTFNWSSVGPYWMQHITVQIQRLQRYTDHHERNDVGTSLLVIPMSLTP